MLAAETSFFSLFSAAKLRPRRTLSASNFKWMQDSVGAAWSLSTKDLYFQTLTLSRFNEENAQPQTFAVGKFGRVLTISRNEAFTIHSGIAQIRAELDEIYEKYWEPIAAFQSWNFALLLFIGAARETFARTICLTEIYVSDLFYRDIFFSVYSRKGRWFDFDLLKVSLYLYL